MPEMNVPLETSTFSKNPVPVPVAGGISVFFSEAIEVTIGSGFSGVKKRDTAREGSSPTLEIIVGF